MNPDEVHSISQQLGRLTGEVIGIKDLIVAHQSEADHRWNRIDEDTLKLDVKINTLTNRVIRLERLTSNLKAIIAFIVTVGGIVGWALANYGGLMLNWLRGK